MLPILRQQGRKSAPITFLSVLRGLQAPHGKVAPAGSLYWRGADMHVPLQRPAVRDESIISMLSYNM